MKEPVDWRVGAAEVKTWSKKAIELLGFMSRIPDVNSDPLFALSAET